MCFLQVSYLLNKILRKPKTPFPQIDQFIKNVADARNLCVVVGGPFTSLHQALKMGGAALKSKITSCHAMMGAWDIGKPTSVNLFKNQFNVGADLHAAQAMLVTPSEDALQTMETIAPGGFPMFLIPTETCKAETLALTPEKLRQYVPDNLLWGQDVLNLYSLWYDVSGKRPFFIFDFAPVISACIYGSSSDIFKFTRCNARVDKDEQLILTEDVNGALQCADRVMDESQTKRYFDMLSRIFDDAALLHKVPLPPILLAHTISPYLLPILLAHNSCPSFSLSLFLPPFPCLRLSLTLSRSSSTPCPSRRRTRSARRPSSCCRR
jgi:inosine-uridine nucleoside N-ribohydrolase